jgi:hypothetical protein
MPFVKWQGMSYCDLYLRPELGRELFKYKWLPSKLSRLLDFKEAVLLDFSREFQETTSNLNHFAREETVLAGLRLIFGSSPSVAPRARLG